MKFISLFYILSAFIYISSIEPGFQEKLFSNIYEEKKENNIMISPLSIYQVLSILSNGAGGATQKEILEVIDSKEVNNNINELLDKINNNFENITSNLETLNTTNTNNQNKRLIFNNANGFFVNKNCKIKESFKSIINKYNAYIDKLINASQINDFCKKSTNGKIPKIIDNITEETAFILINAIYFKGYWEIPFNKNNTKKRIFENRDNSLIEVDTMYNYFEDIKYYKDDNVQMIALPYISQKLPFKMIIILPNKEKYSSPLDYIKKENINYNELFSKLQNRYKNIHLYLPKFKVEFNILLNKTFKEMNMNLAFSSLADFSNIIEDSDRPIYIEEIMHKTYIEIDEEGTEAAAVTVAIGVFGSAPPSEEVYMYVNHSFIYAIVCDNIKDHNGNYLIPFIGVINNLEGNIIKNGTKSDGNIDNNNNNDNSKENNNEETTMINQNDTHLTNILNNSFSNNSNMTETNNKTISFETNKSEKYRINLYFIILILMVFIN